jgi:hypothetical protein
VSPAVLTVDYEVVCQIDLEYWRRNQLRVQRLIPNTTILVTYDNYCQSHYRYVLVTVKLLQKLIRVELRKEEGARRSTLQELSTVPVETLHAYDMGSM